MQRRLFTKERERTHRAASRRRGAFVRGSILTLVIAVSVLAPLQIASVGVDTAILESNVAYAQDFPVGDAVRQGPVARGESTAIETDPVSGIWESIKSGLAYAMLSFSGWVLGISGLFFNGIIELTVQSMGFLLNPATGIAGIDIAWRVLRDVVNMLFIFVLLYIAIATILRIEEYGAKRLLARLVIVALLINFSLFFTRVVIDASNVLTNEFVNGIKQLSLTATPIGTQQENIGVQQLGGISGAFVQPLKLATIYDPGTLSSQNIFTIGLAGSLFLLIAAFIFFAGAILLAIRFIMVIFLMVTSPIAFAGMLLPATQQYTKQWWQELFKQAIFAPVYMALLLVVAIIVNDKGFSDNITSKGSFGTLLSDPSTVAAPPNEIGPVLVVLNFMIVSGLMIMALVVAQKMGISGAAGLANLGKRLGPGTAAFFGRRAIGFAGRKWNEWTTGLFLEARHGKKPGVLRRAAFVLTNPVAAARGWEARAKELEHLATSSATAGGREVVEQALTTPILSPTQWFSRAAWQRGGWFRSQLTIPYRNIDERRDENEFMKDYTGMRKESLMHAAVQSEHLSGAEGSMRRRAIVKAAAAQGYLDDLMRMKTFAEKYGDEDGTIYSAETLNRFFHGYLQADHDDQAMRLMAEDMEELGKSTGHYEYLGHAYFDPDSGKWKRGFEVTGKTKGLGGNDVEQLRNTWQASYAAGELAKIGARERLKIAPHNFVPIRAELNEDGTFKDTGDEIKSHISFGRKSGELDEFSRAILSKFGGSDMRDAHFMQPRTKHWLFGEMVDRNTGEIIVNSEEEVQRIKSLWHENPEMARTALGQIFGYAADVARQKLPGVKIAYFKRDASGNVRKVVSTEQIGEPENVVYPIIGAVADAVEKNPNLKVEKFTDKGAKVKEVVQRRARDVFGGKVSKSDLEAEFKKAIGDGELPKSDEGKEVTAAVLADEVFKAVTQTIQDNYDPTPMIEKINSELSLVSTKDKKLTLSAGEERELAHELSDAYSKAWKLAVDSKTSLDSPGARDIIKRGFESKIWEISQKGKEGVRKDLLEQIRKVKGIDYLVEHVRPSERS